MRFRVKNLERVLGGDARTHIALRFIAAAAASNGRIRHSERSTQLRGVPELRMVVREHQPEAPHGV
jgi:hypothetical protein